MSSLACSLLAVQPGLEPVLQIAARDRTRMGPQAEVLGASAPGIRNVLCLTGDHPRLGAGAPRPGVNGLHFMAAGWESIVPRLMKEAGLHRPPPASAGGVGMAAAL
jgi:5,10-methylenetetrahydrofolate reductase